MKVQADYTTEHQNYTKYSFPQETPEIKAINSEAMMLFYKVSVAMIYAFMPHLPEDKRNIRAIAKILGKDHTTVYSWIKKVRGGESTK